MSDQIQMDRIDVGGIRIAYRRAGMGPPLVLLHGGPSDSREWHYQLEGLSDEFALVAWDMPGCGQSADPPEHFLHTRDYADCLVAFIEALGLRQPHVLGLSFGSGLALELYRWYPRIPGRSFSRRPTRAGRALSPRKLQNNASSAYSGSSMDRPISLRGSSSRPCSATRHRLSLSTR